MALPRLTITTRARSEMVEITSLVREAVQQSGAREGLCCLFVPHTTAGITINENADPNVARDLLAQWEKIAPTDGNYLHQEGNAPAHVKASLVGSSEVLLVERGDLVLGTWQGIFLCEFDGPRQRTVMVKTMSG